MSPGQAPSLDQVLRLFDETTGALSTQVRRLEEVLTQKQAELVAANAALAEKVRQLDDLRSWLELVLGSVASSVVAIDPEGLVTTANDAAATLLRGRCADPIGADWRALFPGSPLLAVLRDGATRRYEVQLAGRALACSGAPVRASDGRILGAVEVAEDITELRRLREAAERADRLKQLGEMAAGVAHEIRNPLTGIAGFASLLERELPTDGDERERRCRRWAAQIGSGVRDLDAIVSGLLDYTRPRPPQRRACDPAALLRDCAEVLRADLPEGIALDLALGDGAEQPIQADPGQLRQVLLNLGRNAIQAVAEHGEGRGRVQLAAVRSASGGVLLTVDDSGPGVDPDLRPRLFAPFVTGRAHGTGLGLAICQVLIQGHGGTIAIATAPLGGARFAVELPG